MADTQNSGADDQKDIITEQEDGIKSSDNQAGADSGADGGAGASEDEKGDDKSQQSPKDSEDDEPPTRKRTIDYILERKDRKIAKLQEKANQAKDDEEEDDVSPEDKELVTKVMKPFLQPFIEKQVREENERELSEFVAERPEFKPFQAKILKYMSHPSRQNLPVKTIAYEIAGDELLKIGAQQGRKADEDAKKTQTGGGNNREVSGEKSVWELSPEEFAAKQEEIRRKR